MLEQTVCLLVSVKMSHCRPHHMTLIGHSLYMLLLMAAAQQQADQALPSCYDKESRCSTWAAGSQCVDNPHYMLEYCPSSCKVRLASAPVAAVKGQSYSTLVPLRRMHQLLTVGMPIGLCLFNICVVPGASSMHPTWKGPWSLGRARH